MAKRQCCPCQGETLDRLLQPALLALLAAGPASGYDLMHGLGKLPAFKDTVPDAAGVYRTLRGMETRGLLSGTWKTSASGPAKRVLRITPAGHECLGRWGQTLERSRRDLSAVLRLVRSSTT